MKKRIFVTGASGLLGTALCRACLSEYEVRGTDLLDPKESLNIQFHKLDITEKNKTRSLMTQARPDIVIHAAAYTDVDACEKEEEKAFAINADGTQNVAAGAKEAGAIFYYISTDFVFDGTKKSPYTEQDIPNPVNIYGASKLKGERLAAGIADNCVIIRSSWMFGKYGRNFVESMLKKAETEKQICVVKDQVGSPTYAPDLAQAIIALIKKIKNKTDYGIYHVTNAGITSWYDYAKSILLSSGIAGVDIKPITSDELARPAKRPKMSALNNSKYEKLTGHRMRNYNEALKEYLSEKGVV